jgi:hypothetical protein
MDQYDFISKKITENQVKGIISEAGYDPSDYLYSSRVSGDGYLVQGEVGMNINRLENAAKALRIKVDIFSPNTAAAAATAEDGSVGTEYTVTISLDETTINDLVTGNFKLYGFKAVQTSQGGGAPLVWFATQNFMAETVVDWEEHYQAFTSLSQIISGGKIVASSPYDITLDQTLNVAANGVGTVVEGGTPLAISINNTTNTQFTCGVSEMQGGSPLPLCAFPLFGNSLDVIAPIEKVLFMFSTVPVNTGTVIEQAYSQGILIDLTGDNQRSVSYNINKGWDWGGFSWGQAIPANANLVPLLIEAPTDAFRRSLLARKSY